MSRRLRTAAVAGLLTLGVVGGGAAVAATTGPAIHTFTPKSEQQITNIDVLRQQIRNYYGDPLGSGVSSPDSSYAREAEGVARAGQRWLRARTPDAHHHARHHSGTPAIVLDVDDTTLLTWNYEIASNWAYNPVTNGEYVTGQRFPAVPGMVSMVTWAAKHGIAVFYVTGRPSPQEAATLGNLTSDGIGVDARYPAPTTLPDGEDGLFTKPAVNEYPQYLRDACAGDPDSKCTTIHYKAATRAHIESLGYDIVANFGDQYSDLKGGHADRTFKLPNPNYFLP
jgi:predicted secreted acid phosphatase